VIYCSCERTVLSFVSSSFAALLARRWTVYRRRLRRVREVRGSRSRAPAGIRIVRAPTRTLGTIPFAMARLSTGSQHRNRSAASAIVRKSVTTSLRRWTTKKPESRA